MRPPQVSSPHAREFRARRAPSTVLLLTVAFAGPLLCSCSETPSTDKAISSLVQRAQQASDDASYFPVEVKGTWMLSGPRGTWLQSTIDATSSPWRWRKYPCAALDPSLANGMKRFMLHVIKSTFAGPLEVRLKATFERRLADSDTDLCIDPNGGRIAYGPPGPILDRTSVRTISVDGKTATVTAEVHVTDWQGGVTHLAVPGGGRKVGWAVVPGLLDSEYFLKLGAGNDWKVTAVSSSFAPGHEP